MKFKLLNDVLDIVDLENRSTGDETRVGGFDLVYKDGPVTSSKPCIHTALMGADFDRRLNVFKPKPADAAGISPPAVPSGRSGSGSRSSRSGGGGGGGSSSRAGASMASARSRRR